MAVSIQQASANALAAFLAAKMPDVKVSSAWPSPTRELPAKAITVITAGSRRDTPIDRKLLAQANSGMTRVNSVWQIAACTQPLQLDVWAQSDFARDAMVADLDIFLNYGEKGLGSGNYDIGSGLLLRLADGWEAYESTADFSFDEDSTDDTNQSAMHNSYRATLRGNSYVMLAVPSNTPRQLLINFPMFLDGDTVATTYNTDL